MSQFENQVLLLNEAIKDQNIHEQAQIVSYFLIYIEKSENQQTVTEEYLRINLANAINDVISTKLPTLMPTLKLIRYFMEDYHFRTYLALPILQNIFRVLIFIVRSDDVKKNQLEFFDNIVMLNDLLKKFLEVDFKMLQKESMQATFICLQKFIALVLSTKSIAGHTKLILVEIFLSNLKINQVFNCLCRKFELTMEVANLADDFLNRLIKEYYKRNKDDWWLYKILQVLFQCYESFVAGGQDANVLEKRIFENIFYGNIEFILKQLSKKISKHHDPNIFFLSISILNTVLLTPGFNIKFYSKILKMCTEFNVDVIALSFSKHLENVSNFTRYTMKMFISALVAYSVNFPIDKHKILDIFLKSNLFDSLMEIKSNEVVENSKALILLYGCSFIRERFANPLYAHTVLENLVVIMNHLKQEIDDNEIWIILKTFAYCSNFAVFSALEYVGVQKISENLLEQAFRPFVEKNAVQPIDKYIVSFAKEFSTNAGILNCMVFHYLCQEPKTTSTEITIPTNNMLPLLASSNFNQVENAVKFLQVQHLTETELMYIVDEYFCNLEVEEFTIEAALKLISAHSKVITKESQQKIYNGIIGFFKEKQTNAKFSNECYMCMMETGIRLIVLKTEVSYL